MVTTHRARTHQPALAAFCRRALRGVLLTGALAPLGCDRAAPRSAAAKSTPDAATRPNAAGTPHSVFDADRSPVAPARPSQTFAHFPCGAPVPEGAEQQRLSTDAALYERYQALSERLELDLRARSLNLPSQPDYIHVSRAVSSESVRTVGQPLPMIVDRLAARGNACARATDRPRCEAELKRQSDEIFAKERCDTEVCNPLFYFFAQTTSGDQVRTWVGPQRLTELFGEIDTPMEGWFLLMARRDFVGYQCGEDVPLIHHSIAYRTTPEGHVLRGIKATSSCEPLRFDELSYEVTRTGAVRQLATRIVSNDPDGCVVGGRRPQGFSARRGRLRSLVDLLARSAELESASIDAFDALAKELGALGAPNALIRRTRAAQRDERAHAACMTQLTEQLGGRLQRAAQVSISTPRDRLALALDNAREGCVRELYGALVAAFQAQRAQLPALREAFARIARDELRHAALSWDLADWLAQGLDAAQQAQIMALRAAALRELRAELSEPSPALRRDAGLPSLAESHALADAVASWVELRTSSATPRTLGARGMA